MFCVVEKLPRPQSDMKPCVCAFVLGMILHGASARIHSLRYFHTASSGIKGLPEFVGVGMVDGVVFTHFDSDIKRKVPKQDWMDRVTEGDPQYWERGTQLYLGSQQVFKVNIEVVKQRLNQTGGVHIVQEMYGCEWDDETGEVKGYRQHGFDGEDFIAYDFKTETWVAPRQEAFMTKLKWDRDEAQKAYMKYYHTQECPEFLKKYVGYGKSTLMRTVLPSISLLQKSSSSPVTCHATGFYPDGAMLFWTKDGDELYEGVELWEILPNPDGTFQKSADLNVSSIPAEDWDRYSCVFQLSGVKEDVLTKLDRAVIRSNRETALCNHEKPPNPLLIAAAVVGVCVAVVAALGFVLYWRKKAKRAPTPLREPEVEQELNPKS